MIHAVFLCCLHSYRDQSASATFYYREKSESEGANETEPNISASAQQNMVTEWMYYRTLKHGESEFPLRNKQVRRSGLIGTVGEFICSSPVATHLNFDQTMLFVWNQTTSLLFSSILTTFCFTFTFISNALIIMKSCFLPQWHSLWKVWIYMKSVSIPSPHIFDPCCVLQVKQRANECIRALDRLTEINSGIPVQNVLQSQFDWTTLEVTSPLLLSFNRFKSHLVFPRWFFSSFKCDWGDFNSCAMDTFLSHRWKKIRWVLAPCDRQVTIKATC